MRLLIIGLSVALILTACATRYQPMGFSGGVEDMQISDDTYRIRARGNALTRPEKVEDFVLLRSSEIALNRGYPYFTIVQSTDRSIASSYTTPETVQVSGGGAGYGFAADNCSPNCWFPRTETATAGTGGFGFANSTRTPAETHVIIKPGGEVIVRLLKSKENIPGLVYEAAAVHSSLSAALRS